MAKPLPYHTIGEL